MFGTTDFWVIFWANLLADTIVALGIGILVAVWVQRREQRQSRRQEVKLALRSLKDELLLNQTILQNTVAILGDQNNAARVLPTPEPLVGAWQAALEGGILRAVEDYELLNALSSTYEQLRYLNGKTALLWKLHYDSTRALTGYQNLWRSLADHIVQTSERLSERIPGVVTKLDSELGVN